MDGNTETVRSNPTESNDLTQEFFTANVMSILSILLCLQKTSIASEYIFNVIIVVETDGTAVTFHSEELY